MTHRERRLERLNEVCDSVSVQAQEDFNDQALKVAGNLMLLIGHDFLLTAEGFIVGIQKATTAAIMWAISEGYATLNDSATASETERAARAKKVASNEEKATVTDIGGYM